MKIIIKITLTAFVAFLISGCGGVKMNDAKSVAGGFSKSILEGNIEKAKKLSLLDEGQIKKLVLQIKDKYKDFTLEQFLENNIFVEKAVFIPKKIDDRELKISFYMKLKANKEYAVFDVKYESSNSKEGVVKQFAKSIIDGNLSSASGMTENPAVLKKILATLKGASKFTILQLSADDPAVMIEFSIGDNSKILNFKIIKKDGKFIISDMKLE